jgi:hypothetical protein
MALPDTLPWFEMPRLLVEPTLHMCRGFNTILDALFYDVSTLARDLRSRNATISTSPGNASPAGGTARGLVDLSADHDPEGALLLVNPARPPYVTAWQDVAVFLAWALEARERIDIVSITGVGSSALGSAALAWDIATAFAAPVLAIVPGYGVADLVLQGLGGSFGFELYNLFNLKSRLQDVLARTAPGIAWAGRELAASAPGSAREHLTGAPVFETGSGSSDVLHLLLQKLKFRCLVGHSKGALSIGNAIRSLDADATDGLRVVTLGCPIAEEIEGVSYHQFLGWFDALGQLNSLGNPPQTWTLTTHSTNACLPLSMPAGVLAAQT